MKHFENARSNLPSPSLLAAIDNEQNNRRKVVDGSWRIACAILIGAVVVADTVTWLLAAVLILAVIFGTRLTELEIRACSTRIAAVRRTMMMLEEGEPSENVHRLVKFLNSPGMLSSISRYQNWGYWAWTVMSIIVILAKAMASF